MPLLVMPTDSAPLALWLGTMRDLNERAGAHCALAAAAAMTDRDSIRQLTYIGRNYGVALDCAGEAAQLESRLRRRAAIAVARGWW